MAFVDSFMELYSIDNGLTLGVYFMLIVLFVDKLASIYYFWSRLGWLAVFPTGTCVLPEFYERKLEELREEIRFLRDNYAIWSDEPVLEALIAGSEGFERSAPPSNQMKILTRARSTTSDFEYNVGQAVCMRVVNRDRTYSYFFVTAEHVVNQCASKFRLVGPTGSFEVTRRDFKSLGKFDISYMEVGTKEMQRVGVSAARPQVVGDRTPAYIIALGKKYPGVCMDGETIGVVSFDGSTESGFSGAAYLTSDKSILAIHTTGRGTRRGLNCGVSADMIAALLVRGVPESSEDYYEDVIRNQHTRGKLVWGYSHPDETDYVVFRDARGRYHEVGADVFERVMEKHGIQSSTYYREGGKLEDKTFVMKTKDFSCEAKFAVYEEVTGVYAQVKGGPVQECSTEMVSSWVQHSPQGKTRETQIGTGLRGEVVKEVLADAILESAVEPASFLGERGATVSGVSTSELPEIRVPSLDEVTTEFPTSQDFEIQENSDTSGHVKTHVQRSEVSTCRWVEQLVEQRVNCLEERVCNSLDRLERMLLQNSSLVCAQAAAKKLQQPSTSGPSGQNVKKRVGKEEQEKEKKRLEEEKKAKDEKKKRLKEISEQQTELKRKLKELARELDRVNESSTKSRGSSRTSSIAGDS